MAEQRAKKKVCKFCVEKRNPDYKNYDELRNFITEHGKILPIKRARQLALLPYVKI